MAALALVGAMTAGCSSDDLTADTPLLPDAAGGTVTMKTTITLDERASTRALDADGKKTFAAGDQIAVIYQNTSGETVKTESAALTTDDIDATNTQNATFSVSLTNPKASGKVRYIYPASMAADDVSTTTPDKDATIKWTNLNTQDGTLATLASNYDLGVFDGLLTSEATLPNSATLANPLTIGAFTIKNSGGKDMTSTITKLIVDVGTNTYTVKRTAAAGPIYVAMKPISKKTIKLTVNTNSNKFIKSFAGKTFKNQNYYPVTATMGSARYPRLDFAESDDIGSILGANGYIYLNAAAAAADGTTAQAAIVYAGGVYPYFDKFLAVGLTDLRVGTEISYSLTQALSAMPAYADAHKILLVGDYYDHKKLGYDTSTGYYDTVADNINTTSATADYWQPYKGWRIPSVTDWRYLIQGLLGRSAADPVGVSDDFVYYDGKNLEDAINEACGNDDFSFNLSPTHSYWTSSYYGKDIIEGMWTGLEEFWCLHSYSFYYGVDSDFGASYGSVRPVFVW